MQRIHVVSLLAVLLSACTGSVGAGAGGGSSAGPGKPSPSNPGPPGSKPPPGTQPPGTQPPGTQPPGTQPPGTSPPLPPGACPLPTGRIWPLTPAQYARTLESALPNSRMTVEELSGQVAAQEGFSNVAGRLALSEPYVGQLLQIVWQLSSAASADPGKLAPCLAQGSADACVRTFIEGFGAKLFRRDLAGSEVDALLAYHRKQVTATDARSALRALVTTILTSPNALFRSELGPESPGSTFDLTAFERAQALSFFLTDGPPDAQLSAAARSGALANPADVETHTRRLLGRQESAGGFVKFIQEALQTRAVLSTDKDEMVFAAWTEELRNDLAAETDGFVRQVLWGEGAKLSSLLAGEFTMLNARLAAFYGVSGAPAGTAFGKVPVRAGQRAGFFTQAGMMASLAHDNDTDAVARGRFVREVLLCQPLPPPPATVNVTPVPPDGKRTQRERLGQHSSDTTCSGCHSLMDPLGLAFESYDGIGRHRTTDVGQPLDTSGKLTGAIPDNAPFKDGVELMNLLAKSPTASRCFVETAFRYAHGRSPETADSCVIDHLSRRFEASGGDIMDLTVAITTDESFLRRQRANP